MEVTRKNFKETLPLVAESINKADFLVIDAEFTGLINGRDVSMFDSPQEYYLTLWNNSTDFLLIQFGLCAFCWNDEKKCYRNDSYNFYLFPRGRPGPEKMFLCQSSSMDFLATQGFDFNKLIREGISYMTEPTETRLRENLTERQKSYDNDSNSINIPEENKSQIEEICKRVRDFLDEKKGDEMDIDRCNSFIRRLLFQEIGKRFKDEAFVETKVLENGNRILKVSRITGANESLARDNDKKKKEWDELEEAVGFTKVAGLISQSDKLVVGHNMLLDVLHTLNHFFQPLPGDYKSFKEFAKFVFPRLLDTKYMSSLPPFKDKVNSSVLSHLLATLSEPPFSLPNVECVEGRGYNQSNEKHHEAGFDAYVTGLCLLGMHEYLMRMRGDGDANTCSRLDGHGVVLKPFLNKLYLAKTAYQDSPYMNLDGADPTPSRDHVFHLTFPKQWQRNDINQLFSAYGQVTVQFIDETSALVALSRRDLAKTMAKALAAKSSISIVPFAKYKMLTNKASAPMKRKQKDIITNVQTPDSCSGKRQAGSNEPLPEKTRSRSNSASTPATTPSTRKRTSSGVFQVEETEPVKKKLETRPLSDEAKESKVVSNGQPKSSEREVQKEKEKKIIEKFDTDSKEAKKCVAAFRESDNWD